VLDGLAGAHPWHRACDQKEGNIFSDVQSLEDTLWKMSQDPLTGNFH